MNDTYSKFLAYKPEVKAFFDAATHTVSYVVADPESKVCAVIDSVLDYEPHGATLSHSNADAIVTYITDKKYTLEWILETHVHADHISAAVYIQEKLGGKIAIGKHITDVQKTFAPVFRKVDGVAQDGNQFDVLWNDEDTFMVGNIPAQVLHTPGHTPADVVYMIGDALFVGDTLFMPDYGTARCDFPGGNAETLYDSVQKIFTLPEEMRMFLCHDYLPEGRAEFAWQTTVGEQKRRNIHMKEGTSKEAFVHMRSSRDKTLGMPALIIPSIQINMHAGHLPIDAKSGEVYLTVPVNNVFSKE